MPVEQYFEEDPYGCACPGCALPGLVIPGQRFGFFPNDYWTEEEVE